jgi:hypothetical protein
MIVAAEHIETVRMDTAVVKQGSHSMMQNPFLVVVVINFVPNTIEISFEFMVDLLRRHPENHNQDVQVK